MTDLDRFAEATCRDFLTTADLKEVCRHRGFSPPGGDKEKLVSFLIPRLLEPTGLTEAVATLDEFGRTLLHAIAHREGEIALADLRLLFASEGRKPWLDDREVFRRLTNGLLNRGIVLIGETGSDFGRSTRLSRARFVLPDCHRKFLPPFPVTSSPLGQGNTTQDESQFCLSCLSAAVSQAGATRPTWPKGLLGGVASRFSFKNGSLCFAGQQVTSETTLLDHVKKEWASAWALLERSADKKNAFRWAVHILSHLPPGHGCTSLSLEEGLGRLGLKVKKANLEGFLEDGHAAGFLASVHASAGQLYSAATSNKERSPSRPFAFEPGEGGLRVDLRRTGLPALIEISQVSTVVARSYGLVLKPSIPILAKARERWGEIAGFEEVRRRSPAFEEAIRYVEKWHGKLVLHQGLAVLRVEDLGLCAQIVHKLGDQVRSLGGPYLAVTRGALEKAEQLIRKEGFTPRRISSEPEH